MKNLMIKNLGWRIFSVMSSVIIPVDYLLINRIKEDENLPSVIFIVGAPRTGSTILYQLLTYAYNFNYISNLGAQFYHSLYLGNLIQNYLQKDKTHSSFTSVNGKTEGLFSPHECGKFWYRWFPKSPQFVDEEYYEKNNFRLLLNTVSKIYHKNKNPIIFKNTVNSMRIRVIKKLFPNALIIFIRRNPVETALSILKQREKINKDKNKWWAIEPPNYNELKNLPYPEQIYYSELQIAKDVKLFDSKQIYEIFYEQLCSDTLSKLNQLDDFFIQNNLNIKKRNDLNNFVLNCNQNSEHDPEYILLKTEADKLDWNF
jgi:hypothetical protein